MSARINSYKDLWVFQLEEEACRQLDAAYGQIIGQLAKMIDRPGKWLQKKTTTS